MYRMADDIMKDYFDAVFARMDPEDIAQMTAFMEKMYGIAREELDCRLARMKDNDGGNGK